MAVACGEMGMVHVNLHASRGTADEKHLRDPCHP
jgi:hypothetical protein